MVTGIHLHLLLNNHQTLLTKHGDEQWNYHGTLEYPLLLPLSLFIDQTAVRLGRHHPCPRPRPLRSPPTSVPSFYSTPPTPIRPIPGLCFSTPQPLIQPLTFLCRPPSQPSPARNHRWNHSPSVVFTNFGCTPWLSSHICSRRCFSIQLQYPFFLSSSSTTLYILLSLSRISNHRPQTTATPLLTTATTVDNPSCFYLSPTHFSRV